MRSTFGLVCMVAGGLLLAAALALVLHNQLESREGQQRADEALAQVAAVVSDVVALPDPYDPAMTEVQIDGVSYVGYLSIPEVGVELPVTAEWDYDLLQTAACRYAGSTKTDDLVLAVHNYLTGYLGVFSSAPVGAAVYLVDMDGVRHAYRIVATEVLAPTDIDGMVAGEYDLTVFSCTYGGANRVAIRCDRAEG